MLKITRLPLRKLDPGLESRWAEIQTAAPHLDSPFFRPEFARAVAAARPRSEVGLIETQGQIVGLFPYERGRFHIGHPLGGRMSDFQAIVGPADLPLPAHELLRGCALSGWRFDHLLVEQPDFQPYHRRTAESPYLDVSGGFDAYRSRVQAGQIAEWLRKGRKLEREVGPLRTVFSTQDAAVFRTLLEWKAAQYRRTDAVDVFGFQWTVEVLERILAHQAPEFGGMLSALYAGNELVAVHFGMQSRHVLHSWFPAYSVEYSRYSPGALLFLELAREADARGIRRIDLGRGDASYKQGLLTGSVHVAEGCVPRGWVSRLAYQAWPATRAWLKASPFQTPVRWLGRATRPIRGRVTFR